MFCCYLCVASLREVSLAVQSDEISAIDQGHQARTTEISAIDQGYQAQTTEIYTIVLRMFQKIQAYYVTDSYLFYS